MKYLAAIIVSAFLVWLYVPATVTVHADAGVKPRKAASIVATTKAALAAPQKALGCNAYLPLLNKYDWDVKLMAAIMKAESDCHPEAVNPYNYDGIADFGLLQLHGVKVFDPAQNIAAGYRIWQRQGYQAWTTYNNSQYKLFYGSGID